MGLSNEEKAIKYDDYIRESDMLQRMNSKLKSEYSGNIPPHVQHDIDRNDRRIAELVYKLESLFSDY